jgi:hypothetical protein
MKTKQLTVRSSWARRWASLSLLAATVAAGSFGCNEGAEGDRCNPALIDPATGSNHDECGSSLICQQPSSCAESYCCPKDPSKSTNPFCNGSACSGGSGPGDDGGTDGAQE